MSPLANKRVSSRNNRINFGQSPQNSARKPQAQQKSSNNVVKDNSVVRKRFMQMMSGIVDDQQLKEVQHFIENEEEQSRSLKNKKKLEESRDEKSDSHAKKLQVPEIIEQPKLQKLDSQVARGIA